MADNFNKAIKNEINFWESKEQLYEEKFVCCENECGCVNKCKNKLNSICNCDKSEYDVCPKCMDSIIDASYKEMIEGKAEKEQIELVIELKTLLKSLMNIDLSEVQQLDKEIKILDILSKNQKM